MATILQHPDGAVSVDDLPDGRKQLSVQPHDPAAFVAMRRCQSSYPIELIRELLAVKGPAYLCDEITRDERPTSVSVALKYGLLSYLDEASFAGARLLDFGCGSGASTMVLARMLPDTEIVGVDLDERLLTIARLRAAHYGLANIQFMASPSGDRLPAGIGTFNFVCLSAVFEHLLPHERHALLPMLWTLLAPGGVLFLNQTPHRYFPIDIHTTGLPLISFLPDRLALAVARRFSPRVRRDESWESLLRRGIRGGTEREVLGILRSGSSAPVTLLRPTKFGLHDSVDVWDAITRSRRSSRLRRLAKRGFKIASAVSRSSYGSWLYMAARKGSQPLPATE